MFVRPMPLSEIDRPFDDPDWITELKFDGIRLIYSMFGEPRLYSRRGREWTADFPELLHTQLPKGSVLDGDLIAPDVDGKSNFECLLRRLHSKRNQDISVLYCVFDVLYFNGHSVMDRPLTQRKDILSEVLQDKPEGFLKVPYLEGQATCLFSEYICGWTGLEGIVQKKNNSVYQSVRSKEWLKVVAYRHASVQIVGIRKEIAGLPLVYPDGQPAGALLSLRSHDRKMLLERMQVMQEMENLIQILPIPCQVKYRMKTKNGKLRHPIFEKFL